MLVDNVCTYWRAIQRRTQEATSERPFFVFVCGVTVQVPQAVFIYTYTAVSGNSPPTDGYKDEASFEGQVFLSNTFRITITNDLKTKEVSSDVACRTL